MPAPPLPPPLPPGAPLSVTDRLVIGVGCTSSLSDAALTDLLDHTLPQSLWPQVCCLASLDRRCGLPVLQALATRTGLPLHGVDAATLRAVAARFGLSDSAASHFSGVPAVAEAAALSVAGPGATLWLAKRRGQGCTVAIARFRPASLSADRLPPPAEESASE